MITICIVDDHTALSDGLQIYLEQDSNFKVLSCNHSGLQLLKDLETVQPQIVITDIGMPDMDGYELCQRIKTAFPSIKVVALSMFETAQAVQEMLACGANAYVLKSSPLTTLKTALLQVIDNLDYYDPAINLNTEQIDEHQKRRVELSRSERDILLLIAQGKSSLEISEVRGTAESTVNKHRKNIMYKLGLEGKGELYKYALQRHGYNQ